MKRVLEKKDQLGCVHNVKVFSQWALIAWNVRKGFFILARSLHGKTQLEKISQFSRSSNKKAVLMVFLSANPFHPQAIIKSTGYAATV